MSDLNRNISTTWRWARGDLWEKLWWWSARPSSPCLTPRFWSHYSIEDQRSCVVYNFPNSTKQDSDGFFLSLAWTLGEVLVINSTPALFFFFFIDVEISSRNQLHFLGQDQSTVTVSEPSLTSCVLALLPDRFSHYAWTASSAHFSLGRGCI